MSFEEYEDCFVWKCNTCHKEVLFPPNDFFDCVAELKARGWTFSRDNEGVWNHTCAYCNYKSRQIPIMERTFKTVK